jgi:polyphosphate kinase 2
LRSLAADLPQTGITIAHKIAGWYPNSHARRSAWGGTQRPSTVGQAMKTKLKQKKRDSDRAAGANGKPHSVAQVGDVKAESHKIKNSDYELELARLQIELVKLQEWIKHEGLRLVVIFEGRDAAGKGGTIKRITESLNPRICRVVALGRPTEREQTSWYFQRYVAHLPAAGEMVLLDRSWYNRAGVERVMGFCSDLDYQEFLRSCPEFERMLVRSGIILIKYWFSISDDEQERRFQKRMKDPTRSWKLSPMDVESRSRWVEYSRAKDAMFAYTDIKQAPWHVVKADNKKCARLNCISHLLSMIEYKDLTPTPAKLPPRPKAADYVRPPLSDQTFVPETW